MCKARRLESWMSVTNWARFKCKLLWHWQFPNTKTRDLKNTIQRILGAKPVSTEGGQLGIKHAGLES